MHLLRRLFFSALLIYVEFQEMCNFSFQEIIISFEKFEQTYPAEKYYFTDAYGENKQLLERWRTFER